MDYVYDDHDFMNNNSSEFTSSYTSQSGLNTNYDEIQNPPGARRNSIMGYTEYFPAYPLPDTSQGIYHSFRFGNIEVFVVDNRSSRSPNTEVFFDTGNFLTPWGFDAPAGHSILGPVQLQWLLSGLQNSTADWKFIATGTVFNRAYRDVTDLLLNIQLVQIPNVGSGGTFAADVVDSWAGFPADQDAIIGFCAQNQISNVIFLSGDSHNSAIDNGTNAGFPELMSGNLGITNSRTAFLMDSLLFVDVWSEGGQGLHGNNNFNNAFGKVEVFGSDSVRLCAIDMFGTTITCYTVHDGWVPAGSEKAADPIPSMELFPNPSRDKIMAKDLSDFIKAFSCTIFVMDARGRVVMQGRREVSILEQAGLDISGLEPGIYFLHAREGENYFTSTFVKQ
jgi:hypothetical protein